MLLDIPIPTLVALTLVLYAAIPVVVLVGMFLVDAFDRCRKEPARFYRLGAGYRLSTRVTGGAANASPLPFGAKCKVTPLRGEPLIKGVYVTAAKSRQGRAAVAEHLSKTVQSNADRLLGHGVPEKIDADALDLDSGPWTYAHVDGKRIFCSGTASTLRLAVKALDDYGVANCYPNILR